MRSLVPADSLVYLETNDLAAALQPIIDSKPFTEAAKYKPDFSALKGVQLAVAVTGFETSEEKVNDEQSIGRVQPRFVAIADTHAWNFQAIGFAEQKLGSFVEKIYDSQPALEKSEKKGGKYFTWTADNRKAYALVIDSLIYFGNDESAIEKCLTVKRGEADSIIKTGKIQPADPQTLALGYVSTDGVAQIANIVGLKFASEAAEDSEIQSAVAGILPQLLRNLITDISWTSTKTEQGIEDKYLVSMPLDIANVLNEALAPAPTPTHMDFAARPIGDILTIEPTVLTVYNFKNPQIAWRSLMHLVSNQTNEIATKMLGEFFAALLQSYGIQNPEKFLNQAKSPILTLQCSESGDQSVVAMEFGDVEEIKSSIVTDLKFQKGWPAMVRTIPYGSTLWVTEDDELGVFYSSRNLALGSLDCVKHISEILGPPTDVIKDASLPGQLLKEGAPIISVGKEKESTVPIVELLSELKSNSKPTAWTFSTETRITKTGIDRKTNSCFGLIGAIIAQMVQD